MTTPRSGGRSPGSAGRRVRTVLLTVSLTAVLVALGMGAPVAPAATTTPVAPLASGHTGQGTGTWPGAGTSYVPPVPGVDPPSGVDRLFDPPEEKWGAGHRGVDLIAPDGSHVVAPGPGTVTFAGQVAGRGVVVVTHPDGLRTSLEPVAASVPVGSVVVAGTPVGVIEGAASGAHGTTPDHCEPRTCVHWGVRRGEHYIDPLSLLDRPLIVLLPDR